MPGRPRMKARRLALEAAAKAASLAAAGDPGAADAAIEAGRLAGIASTLLPYVPEPEPPPMAPPIPPPPRPPLPEPPAPIVTVTPIAAPAGDALPLSEEEFRLAASVVSACAGDSFNPPDPDDGDIRFLSAAFPALVAEERVRAARYLSALATAGLRPSEGSTRSAAPDLAMSAAGITYTSFESMRKREYRFDNACDTLIAARRRALMDMLEEELVERAFNGVLEDQFTRAGEVVKLRKYDNKLAFDILRFNHDHYVKTAKANSKTLTTGKGGGGMTLIIGGGKGDDAIDVPSRILKEGGRG